jgi:site-specific recombinase XerD
MIRMLWDTGVRVSELTDLDLTQIDENKHSTVIVTKKNGKKRMIIWSKETHRLLLRYISLRLKLKSHKGSPALFLGQTSKREPGVRITRRSVERIVKYCVDRAGINERITPHSFRHGWAHKRRDQNAPLAFIQRGLGHISPVSTFMYQNYHDWEFEKSARKYLKTA